MWLDGAELAATDRPDPAAALPLSLGPCHTVLLSGEDEGEREREGEAGDRQYVLEIESSDPAFYITLSHVVWR